MGVLRKEPQEVKSREQRVELLAERQGLRGSGLRGVSESWSRNLVLNPLRAEPCLQRREHTSGKSMGLIVAILASKWMGGIQTCT